MKHEPFDLEKALAGEPVVTRDGREVSQVTLFECESKYPLCAVVDDEICSFTKTGGHYDNGQPSRYDLFMKPKTRIVNGFKVPAPETEELDYGTEYCLATPHADYFFRHEIWETQINDKLWLERGLVFLHEEDAIANAKAMVGLDPHGD